MADNYLFPRIDVIHVDWAIMMLRASNLSIMRRVCNGDISDDADHTREQMIVQRCKRWLSDQRKDPKEEGMRVNGFITRRFLQQEVASKDAFKNHRLGATIAVVLVDGDFDSVGGHARSYPGAAGILAARVCGHLVHAVAPVHDLSKLTRHLHDKSPEAGNDFSDKATGNKYADPCGTLRVGDLTH